MDLFEIVRGSTTLAERIEYARRSRGGAPDGVPREDSRLAAWCDAVARGDWAVFQKRLAWDGLDLETARRALDPASVPRRPDLPNWTDVLDNVVRAAPTCLGVGCAETPEDASSRSIPFAEVLAPFVLVARRRLADRVCARRHQLSEEAHAEFERALLGSLSRVAAEALMLEFSILRSREQSSLDRLFSVALGRQERSLYRQFVERMLAGGLEPLFEEYPVLARLLATMTERWIDATAELLERLEADLPAIRALFTGGEHPGAVVAARPALSDPHRGRRFVAVLTFESGLRVVYKPKGLGIEKAFSCLLAWLNRHGAPLPFRVVGVLDRSSHGWVEYIHREPCLDRQAVRRYFQRAGMLLAVVYLLEGTDCHMENLVASGEHPVLVDLETLLHHRVPEGQGAEGIQAQMMAFEQLSQSVLRTGLLPVWQLADEGRLALDISGLGGRGDERTTRSAPTWTHVNTDAMRVEGKPATIPSGPNVPVLDGVPLSLDAHAEDVVQGFRQMYRFLVDQREALLAPDSPLHALARQRVRFIHRPTKIYGAILTRLFEPRYLRDGAARGVELELLARGLVGFAARPLLWPVVHAEQRAMEQVDVPLFTASADGTDLELEPGRVVEGCFPQPSFQLVLARLRALGEADLARQVAFVEGSLYARLAGDAPAAAARGEPSEACAVEPISAESALERALAIAAEMRGRAVRAGDGSAAWIAAHFLSRAERYQFQTVGDDLYSGNAGIGLFLAAVYGASGQADYRDLALATFSSPRHTLATDGDRLADRIGIGGALGLGSIVYALTRASELLGEPALLVDAARAAALITSERIAADLRLDIVGGCAGAILGLLALHGAGGDEDALRRAIACGRRLLAARAPSRVGPRAWATYEGHLMAGAAHGAAGIAYALLRLYQATGTSEFREAAEEGIVYERSLFSSEAGNWPDVRQSDQPAFSALWCHGAAGIGLARLGGLAVLDSEMARRDLEAAIETTRRAGIRQLDQLCCGNLGRAELMLVAGRRLGRPELERLAGRWAATVVSRAERLGGYALHPLLPLGVYNPTLFQGTAGIGYQLLRLAHPGLPSLLLWE